MKKCLGLLLFLMPLSMMLNVHQSKLYLQAKAKIMDLQYKQNQLLEENQRIIAEIARSNAPTVIEHLARSSGANLRKIHPEKVLRIIVPEEDISP